LISADSEYVFVSPDVLFSHIRIKLENTGVISDQASLVARCLVDAERRGHASHGLDLLPTYLERIHAGGINPNYAPVLLNDSGSILRFDAQGGLGQVATEYASLMVAQRATLQGVAVATISNNNHVGMLSAYRQAFQSQGVIGLLLNISGPSLSPPGGRGMVLGSNAVCLVLPRTNGCPLCIDFGTGVVALGKIRVLLRAGLPVPAGWLVDSEGVPSETPMDLQSGGSVPLFGGYKGLCLTLIVEVLAGMIAANTVSPRVSKQRAHPAKPMNCSQFILAISPEHFGNPDLERLLQELQSAVFDGYGTSHPEVWFPDQAENSYTRETENKIRLLKSLAATVGL
jgi:LDH2 family malate/lactate/ureidoglycolate dehydrogenase